MQPGLVIFVIPYDPIWHRERLRNSVEYLSLKRMCLSKCPYFSSEITNCSGSQFDLAVVEAFLRIQRNDELVG